MSSVEFDNLIGSEFSAAKWAELVWEFRQAFVARAMTAVKNALHSLLAVVIFETNAALRTLLNRLL